MTTEGSRGVQHIYSRIGFHTVITPRGAFVRDAKKWSDHLDGTIKYLAKRIRYVKGIGGQLGVSRIFRSTTRTKGTFMDICPAESIAQ